MIFTFINGVKRFYDLCVGMCVRKSDLSNGATKERGLAEKGEQKRKLKNEHTIQIEDNM